MSPQFEELKKLDKPLIIFSLATTGLVLSADKIIRLAYTKHLTNSRQLSGTYLFNPEIAISPEATLLHGLTNDMLETQVNFQSKCQELWELFNHCYYSGFNITRFDLPLLRREFLRCGLDLEYSNDDIIDIKTIYSYLEPVTLSKAYHEYCNKSFEAEHDQQAVVKVAGEVLSAQIKKYGIEAIKRVPNDQDSDEVDLSECKFYWQEGEPYFAFSHFKHLPVAMVAEKERGFLEWMLLADFSQKVKNTVRWVLRKNRK